MSTARILGLLLGALMLTSCVGPTEPTVTCVGVSAEECDRLWRDMLERNATPLLDDQGRNRVLEVIVTRQPGPCVTESIDVRFTDGTGIYQNPGLC